MPASTATDTANQTCQASAAWHLRVVACRALNGIGRREYESPILRSAVQDKPALLYPVNFNYTPRTEVETSSRFSSPSGVKFQL